MMAAMATFHCVVILHTCLYLGDRSLSGRLSTVGWLWHHVLPHAVPADSVCPEPIALKPAVYRQPMTLLQLILSFWFSWLHLLLSVVCCIMISYFLGYQILKPQTSDIKTRKKCQGKFRGDLEEAQDPYLGVEVLDFRGPRKRGGEAWFAVLDLDWDLSIDASIHDVEF